MVTYGWNGQYLPIQIKRKISHFPKIGETINFVLCITTLKCYANEDPTRNYCAVECYFGSGGCVGKFPCQLLMLTLWSYVGYTHEKCTKYITKH